jgi:hypothetical protein
MLSVAIKTVVLSVFMRSVIMLSVNKTNVVAPCRLPPSYYSKLEYARLVVRQT